MRENTPLFPLGNLVATPNALGAVTQEQINGMLDRHIRGDWGDVCKEDWKANDRALVDGTRLFSVYKFASEKRCWIITEADRSSTTVLLPSDY